jgi:2-isopropylmalate synthase
MGHDTTIYDTTLRDGCQGAGISLALRDKLDVARRLDEVGIDYVEGGWPGSNPKDAEFFESIRGAESLVAQIEGAEVAFELRLSRPERDMLLAGGLRALVRAGGLERVAPLDAPSSRGGDLVASPAAT